MNEQDLVFRLRERARIRRQIKDRKSVQEGKPDRISDLLEEAANEIERERTVSETLDRMLNPQYDPLDGPMIKLSRD